MITSKQRAYLRSLAHDIEPILQIGKMDIGDNLIKQVDDALEARELIKLSVLQSCSMEPREALGVLSKSTGAEPVQCIGRKITLYRPSKSPRIEL